MASLVGSWEMRQRTADCVVKLFARTEGWTGTRGRHSQRHLIRTGSGPFMLNSRTKEESIQALAHCIVQRVPGGDGRQ